MTKQSGCQAAMLKQGRLGLLEFEAVGSQTGYFVRMRDPLKSLANLSLRILETCTTDTHPE